MRRHINSHDVRCNNFHMKFLVIIGRIIFHDCLFFNKQIVNIFISKFEILNIFISSSNTTTTTIETNNKNIYWS